MKQSVQRAALAIQAYNFITMMKAIYFIAAFAFATSFVQCRTSRATITKAIAPKDTTKIVQVKNVVDSLAMIDSARLDVTKNNINFQTFSAKIKLDIEDSKGKKPDLVANVRMIKDSIIWVSISATILNVEVARARITKDSVVVLLKQDKQVQYRSLDYLQELTEIPFDFKTLQDMILGNVIFFNDQNISVKKYDDFTLISSTGKDFKNLVTINTGDKLLQHSKLDDLDGSRNRTADFTYDSYSSSAGFPFSTYRQIVVLEKNKIDIRMNFKQFEFNKELSVPFTVPKNYKRN
jgi:hypothetical protein